MTLESFKFWFSIAPKIFKKLINIYVIYTPIIVFWIMFIAVDFNGAMLIDKFQNMTKEAVSNIYSLVSIMTLMYFGFWVLFQKESFKGFE